MEGARDSILCYVDLSGLIYGREPLSTWRFFSKCTILQTLDINFFMMPKRYVYLYGLHHDLQHDGLFGCQWEIQGIDMEQERKLFTRSLTEMVDTLAINCICEEFSEEALQECEAEYTWGWQIASQKDIVHKMVDPTREERDALGIPIYSEVNEEENFCRREAEWMRRIHDLPFTNLLFICGEKHLQSFRKLLSEDGNYEARFFPHLYRKGV